MRFKLDENMPGALLDDLVAAGHDAATCFQEGLAGQKDPTIASHASHEGRILLTFDLDFADLRNYAPGSHAGVVILRLHSQSIPTCRRAVSRLLATITDSDFQGN